MRIPRFLTLLSLALFTLCAASFADIQVDFSTLGSNLKTASFLTSGVTTTVSGYSANNPGGSPDAVLAYKNTAADEMGLGLTDDPSGQNEITGTHFIQITSAGLNSLLFGSVQSGEGWKLYQSNTAGAGSTGSLLASGTATSEPLAGGLDTYIFVFATGTNNDGSPGNILLGATVPSPRVPEPGTTGMILTLGLVGLFEVGRRKLMA